MKIHGVTFSAHTRKVILAALKKQIPYEVVPVVPLAPPDGWDEVSPLGLIPVVEDGEFRLADSSVICLYLERLHPEPPLYPSDPPEFARALWIEEYVDGGLAPHVLGGLLLQRVLAPRLLKRAPDEALVQRSLTEMIPPRLAYLEAFLAGDYFAGGALSVADLAVASILINFHYAGEILPENRYPKLQAFLRRMLQGRIFRTALAAELPAVEGIGGFDLGLLRGLGH
jgi:glutathione S-transferase